MTFAAAGDMLRQQRALRRRPDDRGGSLVEAELVADDPDPADIYCEDHAAGEDAKQKRLEKPALRCDQDDGEDNEPVARREAPAAADAPIPHEFGSELDQQSPQDEARDITYHLSAAHQHSQVRVPPRTPQRLGAPRR